MTESNLLLKIRASYQRLTKLEKQVADYVLENPKIVVKMTINDLASHCGVGDTTVFRFCRTMELAGYQDFKLSLALSANLNDMLDSRNGNGSIMEASDLNELAQNVEQVYVDAVRDTFAQLDFDAVSKTVDAIMKASSVYVYGYGNSGISAQMMQNRMMRIIPNVFYASDAHMQLTSAALLSKDNVAIIFCNSGVTRDCLKIAQSAHQAGAVTVFATNFLGTPAASDCDIILPCGATEGPIQGGSIASIASQLCMVSLLYSELFRRMGDASKENKIKTAQSIAEKKL
ncbi:MAG: MurR/RpiR family transcriptional regulator [Clostridiales bacterium]|nr:MurR/RpiR family transcriptional regulator [Clostridiales bacterium]